MSGEWAVPPETVAEIQKRRPAIPWDRPIRVQFPGHDKPLFGCRLCILRFGLQRGDYTRLFVDEAEASSHSTMHNAVVREPTRGIVADAATT